MTQRTDWVLDEVAHAGAEHLDQGYVAGYDRKAQVDPAPDIELLERHGLTHHCVLVDFGAGTGTLALAAASHCARVIAVDPSPAMVDAVHHRAATVGITNVEVVRAGFLSYAHDGDPADFAYSRNTVHHLPDFWKALALTRVAAVLKPGGVFLLRDIVYAFDPEEALRAIEDWIGAGAASPEEGWTPEELSEHVRGEHSTFSWLLEPMLQRAGFEILEASFAASRVFAAYLCRKR